MTIKDRINAMPYGQGPRVYVAGFSGELVKVGRTQNLRSRLQQLHSFGLRQRDAQLLDWVDFGPFLGRGSNAVEEVTLIKCRWQFERWPGTREWFVRASFDEAVRLCQATVDQRLKGNP